MDQKNKDRLHSLDGLRGLAILLVFFNHINPLYIITTFPFLDRIGLFSSGVTGVSFLFVLSGFFMAYLYPQPKNSREFLQKRYTRIFPLFLTMCVFMFFLSLFPGLFWYQYLLVFIGIVAIAHCIWVYGVQKIQKQFFSRVLFLLFLGLQVCVGLLYAFWIMRKPPAYFGQIVPYPLREAFIGLTNATLTFPFGNYIPMLDGVYWSLAAEILFYVLYPFIIVPVLSLLVSKKRSIKIVFLFALIPFLAAADILSHHIFVLSALQFSLFYYFATGIALAYLYKRYKSVFDRISNAALKKFSVLFILGFLLSITIIHLLNSVVGTTGGPWVRLLFAIPLTIFIGMALNDKNGVGRFLNNKFLIFIGTIGYSIYLSHAAVIRIVTSVFPATDVVSNMVGLFVSFVVEVGIAWCLYVLLEKPYFISRQRRTPEVFGTQKTDPARAKRIVVGIVCVSFVSIFVAFQSNFNFFSTIDHRPVQVTFPSHVPTTISMINAPQVTLQFKASDNNLGIIAVKTIQHRTQNKLPFTPMLTFRLTDVTTNKVIFYSDYVLDEFRGEDFPFGFPTIKDAKNKIYAVDFILRHPSRDNYVSIDTSSFKTVYQLRKGSIIKNPAALFQLLINKFQTIFMTPMATTVLLLLIPFMIVCCVVVLLP